ncbi:Delta-like protein 4 [Trichinella nelsoni]|uniref:Delta-like protein 4 n=1 Tax=Trichinella nelsoni TaxID=6336 RepID=A0A0V0SHB6_9BILA|nr:Delta-like protein 4 [Trichinella nelsoni]
MFRRIFWLTFLLAAFAAITVNGNWKLEFFTAAIPDPELLAEDFAICSNISNYNSTLPSENECMLSVSLCLAYNPFSPKKLPKEPYRCSFGEIVIPIKISLIKTDGVVIHRLSSQNAVKSEFSTKLPPMLTIHFHIFYGYANSDEKNYIYKSAIPVNLWQGPKKGMMKLIGAKFISAAKIFTFRIETRCSEHYYGDDCSMLCNGTASMSCQSKELPCTMGWTGKHCNTPICANSCTAGCTEPDICLDCSLDSNAEDCSHCVPHPDCINGYCRLPGQCICHPGWTGPFCDILDVICNTDNACFNGGVCVNEDDSYKCICLIGYTGERCETKIKGGVVYPCFHNGTLYSNSNWLNADDEICLCEMGDVACFSKKQLHGIQNVLAGEEEKKIEPPITTGVNVSVENSTKIAHSEENADSFKFGAGYYVPVIFYCLFLTVICASSIYIKLKHTQAVWHDEVYSAVTYSAAEDHVSIQMENQDRVSTNVKTTHNLQIEIIRRLIAVHLTIRNVGIIKLQHNGHFCGKHPCKYFVAQLGQIANYCKSSSIPMLPFVIIFCIFCPNGIQSTGFVELYVEGSNDTENQSIVDMEYYCNSISNSNTTLQENKACPLTIWACLDYNPLLPGRLSKEPFQCTFGKFWFSNVLIMTDAQKLISNAQFARRFVQIPFLTKWPGTLAIHFKYFIGESSSTDKGFIYQNVLLFTLSPESKIWNKKTVHVAIRNVMKTFQLHIRVQCGPKYKGIDCATVCHPNVASICSKANLLCPKGWEGDGCLIPKCLENCTECCNEPETCNSCSLTTENENKTCIPRIGCKNGFCKTSGQCLCNFGWTGPLCNIDLHSNGSKVTSCYHKNKQISNNEEWENEIGEICKCVNENIYCFSKEFKKKLESRNISIEKAYANEEVNTAFVTTENMTASDITLNVNIPITFENMEIKNSHMEKDLEKTYYNEVFHEAYVDATKKNNFQMSVIQQISIVSLVIIISVFLALIIYNKLRRIFDAKRMEETQRQFIQSDFGGDDLAMSDRVEMKNARVCFENQFQKECPVQNNIFTKVIRGNGSGKNDKNSNLLRNFSNTFGYSKVSENEC